MDTTVLIILLVLFAGFAVFFLAFFIKGMTEEHRTSKRGDQLRPGLRCANDWAGSLGFFFAIPAILMTSQKRR